MLTEVTISVRSGNKIALARETFNSLIDAYKVKCTFLTMLILITLC